MKQVWSSLKILVFLGIITLIVVIVLANYSFIFSRKVVGVIQDVERVQLNVSLLQTGDSKLTPQLYSFAVAIRQKDGEIVTASAEDRQWAVAHKGQCAEARFYPYPPWDLRKSGTYFNARLDRLFECPADMELKTPVTETLPQEPSTLEPSTGPGI